MPVIRKQATPQTPVKKKQAGKKVYQAQSTAADKSQGYKQSGTTLVTPPPKSQFDMSKYSKELGSEAVQTNLVQLLGDLGSQTGYEMPDYSDTMAAKDAELQAAAGQRARQIAAKGAGRGGGFAGFEGLAQASSVAQLGSERLGVASDLEMQKREDIKLQMQDRQSREALMLQTLVAQGKLTGEEALLEMEKSKMKDQRMNDGLSFIGDALTNIQAQHGPLSPEEYKAFTKLANKALQDWLNGDDQAFIKAGFALFGTQSDESAVTNDYVTLPEGAPGTRTAIMQRGSGTTIPNYDPNA